MSLHQIFYTCLLTIQHGTMQAEVGSARAANYIQSPSDVIRSTYCCCFTRNTLSTYIWDAVSDWEYEENGCDCQFVGFWAETFVGDLFTGGISNEARGGELGWREVQPKEREEIGFDGKERQLHVAAWENAQIQQSKLCYPPLPRCNCTLRIGLSHIRQCLYSVSNFIPCSFISENPLASYNSRRLQFE